MSYVNGFNDYFTFGYDPLGIFEKEADQNPSPMPQDTGYAPTLPESYTPSFFSPPFFQTETNPVLSSVGTSQTVVEEKILENGVIPFVKHPSSTDTRTATRKEISKNSDLSPLEGRVKKRRIESATTKSSKPVVKRSKKLSNKEVEKKLENIDKQLKSDPLNEELKEERKRLRNMLSARKSRRKNRETLQSLESENERLSKIIEDLKSENYRLKQKIAKMELERSPSYSYYQ